MSSSCCKHFPHETSDNGKFMNGYKDPDEKCIIQPVRLGYTVEELAQKFTSCKDFEDPFIIFDMSDVVDKVKIWKRYLPDVDIFYAVKVCDDPLMLKLLVALGCGADCASEFEIHSLLSAGLPPSRIVFAHPCKFRKHISHASNVGVHLTVVDRVQEIQKIKEVDPQARLLIRVKPDRFASNYPSLGLKFGCDINEVPNILTKAKELGLPVEGACFHAGYACEDPDIYGETIALCRKVFDAAIAMGFEPTLLDLGGGFPGSRRKLDLFEQICHVIRGSLNKYFSGFPNLKVIAEPGSYISASCMTVFMKVIGTKEHDKTEIENGSSDGSPVSERSVFLNEGRFGSFFLGNYDYQDCALKVLGDTSGRRVKYQTLWGPTCDSMDAIEKCRLLPELFVDDWISVDNMGSYTLSLPTRFNGFMPPAIKYIMSTEARDYIKSMPEGEAFLNAVKFVECSE